MELGRNQQMKLQQAVGLTVRDLRLSKNLTLRKLSNSSHVSLTFLHEIETGKKNASNEILEAIAKGLDVTTVELVGEIYEYLKEVNNG
jgi:transcriptional regulator with XRE-family HTH domain